MILYSTSTVHVRLDFPGLVWSHSPPPHDIGATKY